MFNKAGGDVINVHEGEVEVISLQDNNYSERLNRYSQAFQDTENETFKISKRLKNNIPGGMGDLRNQQIIQKLSKDKGVIGVYDFKQSQNDFDLLKQRIPEKWYKQSERLKFHQVIENLHKTSEECSHAISYGNNRTNGRWEKSRALNFYLNHSNLRLDLKNDHDNFSFSIWLKQTGNLKKPLSNLISPFKWEEFGNLSIFISRSGKINQQLWGENDLAIITYGDSKIEEGWNHIVYTFGKEEKEVRSRLFLNGILVNEAMPRWTQHISLKRVIIGAVKNKNGKYADALTNVLDQLIIWKKELTEEEIWNLFTNGIPIYDLPNWDFQILAKNRSR